MGQVRKGVVKNITDFGAFIDLGGVDGLLHITDMSYGRVSHPSEVVAIGQEVEVKVLDIDWERERISLGRKQLQEYPWEKVAEKYPVRTTVKGGALIGNGTISLPGYNSLGQIVVNSGGTVGGSAGGAGQWTKSGRRSGYRPRPRHDNRGAFLVAHP